jgi:hypothetical protein
MGVMHRNTAVSFDIGDSPRLPSSSAGPTESNLFACSQPDAVQDRGLIN